MQARVSGGGEQAAGRAAPAEEVVRAGRVGGLVAGEPAGGGHSWGRGGHGAPTRIHCNPPSHPLEVMATVQDNRVPPPPPAR